MGPLLRRVNRLTSEDEIAAIAGSCPPSEAARQFIEMANGRGGRDNITAFVISVRALCPFATESASTPFASDSAPPNDEEPAPFATYVDPDTSGEQMRGRTGWKRMLGIG